MNARSAWLVTKGRVIASAEIADDRSTRRRGLSGRTSFDGAFVIPRCRWIHTLGMRIDIDVAYLDREGTVIKTSHLKRMRLGAPVRQAQQVIEAEAGAFARWGITVGQTLEIRISDSTNS